MAHKQALSRCKPDERKALLAFGLGYSYQEIASGLGWTYTKVNRCIAEGRKRARELTLDDPRHIPS